MYNPQSQYRYVHGHVMNIPHKGRMTHFWSTS
jgi:hypothetical protein